MGSRQFAAHGLSVGIGPKHWAYAQAIAEQWRLMLHHLVDAAGSDMARTRGELLEEKIEGNLARHGEMTARELRRMIKGYESRELQATLLAMVETGRMVEHKRGKTLMYALPGDIQSASPSEGTNSASDGEVPF